MRRQPISKGFAAGLQIWLLFLLSLYWIGYPALLSIALGAIGGLSSGLIIDWWLSKDEKTEAEVKPDRHDHDIEDMAPVRRRRRENSALRNRRRRNEPATALDWRSLLRRNKSDAS